MKHYIKQLSALLVLSVAAFLVVQILMHDSETFNENEFGSELVREAGEENSVQIMTENAEHKPSNALSISPSETLTVQLANTSLADTDVPGALSVDSDGNLIVDIESKAIMDYFLSLSGEMSDGQIRDLMAQWASHSAGQVASVQLLELYDQYLEYKQQLNDAQFAFTDPDQIQQQMLERQHLRNQIFGHENAAALFEEEDLYDQYSFARRDILQSDMTQSEKYQALEAMADNLPEHLAHQHRQQYQLQNLPTLESEIIDAGGTESDIYAVRQEQFGDAAAMRLQELDQQRQLWDDRVQAYRAQRDQIRDSGQTTSDQEVQIQQLRQSLFNDTEQLRIAALDRMTEQELVLTQ